MSLHHSWTLNALVALRELAAEGKPFTSDDLHARIEEPPHHNMLGDAFRQAARLDIIKPTGRTKQSKRPASKGRRIQEWVGSSKQAALL